MICRWSGIEGGLRARRTGTAPFPSGGDTGRARRDGDGDAARGDKATRMATDRRRRWRRTGDGDEAPLAARPGPAWARLRRGRRGRRRRGAGRQGAAGQATAKRPGRRQCPEEGAGGPERQGAARRDKARPERRRRRGPEEGAGGEGDGDKAVPVRRRSRGGYSRHRGPGAFRTPGPARPGLGSSPAREGDGDEARRRGATGKATATRPLSP
jgi:hypothetical protein